MKSFTKIIKKYNEFNTRIKMAKGVKLALKNSHKRDGESGVCSIAYSNLWFDTKNGEALFKTCDLFSFSDMRMLNEVLCYRLCDSVDISCAKYEPAYFNNAQKTKGVISYNFLKPNQKLISLKTFLETDDFMSYVEIMSALKAKQGFFNLDLKQIQENLYKMMIFDMLTFQTDRHLQNISLVLDKEIKLSPLYDNEFAFINLGYTESKKEKTIEEFVNLYFDARKLISYKGLKCYRGKKAFDEMVNQITQMATKNQKFNQIFLDIVKNANIKNIYQTLEKEGYEINPDYRDFTISLFNYSKKQLLAKYKQLINNSETIK